MKAGYIGLGLLLFLLQLTGCQEEKTEVVVNPLTSVAWGNPVVLVDGVDESDLYKDFKITFSKNAYISTSGGPVWKSSGTWKFLNDAETMILVDDLLEVTINQVTEQRLELEFTWSVTTFKETGRQASMAGKNIFQLKRL